MSIRSLVLFVHVVAVIALFSSLILEWVSLNGLQRSTARGEAMAWGRLRLGAQRGMGIAFGIVLLSGIFLGKRIGVLGHGWIHWTYAALLLIGLSGGLLGRRAIRPILLRLRIALALAIVYLMIGKPENGISASVIAIAIAIALLAALLKRPEPSPSGIHELG
jgi:hypothetical protein